MTEDVEYGRREAGKERRASNRENGARILTQHGYGFESRNEGAHLIVKTDNGIIDFWPGTGKWRTRENVEGRGVFRLIAHVVANRKVCGYCSQPARLVRAGERGYPYAIDYGPYWVCVPCSAWVGVHRARRNLSARSRTQSCANGSRKHTPHLIRYG